MWTQSILIYSSIDACYIFTWNTVLMWNLLTFRWQILLNAELWRHRSISTRHVTIRRHVTIGRRSQRIWERPSWRTRTKWHGNASGSWISQLAVPMKTTKLAWSVHKNFFFCNVLMLVILFKDLSSKVWVILKTANPWYMQLIFLIQIYAYRCKESLKQCLAFDS